MNQIIDLTEIMPLPNDDVTPPVTKIYLAFDMLKVCVVVNNSLYILENLLD